MDSNQRPEQISKLALYLFDKEPLIYLFIINSDFIEASNLRIPGLSIAGVSFSNGRVKFFYIKEELDKLSIEELYFLIVHEAFHIFKKHTNGRHKLLIPRWLANIAEDAAINDEIENLTFEGNIKPVMLGGDMQGCSFNEEYFKDNASFKKEDIKETFRYFNWLKEKQKRTKKDLLQEGSFVRVKNPKRYGIITKVNENGTYEIKEMERSEVVAKLREIRDASKDGKQKNGRR